MKFVNYRDKDISLFQSVCLILILLCAGCAHYKATTNNDLSTDVESSDTGTLLTEFPGENAGESEPSAAGQAVDHGLPTRMLVDEARALACTGALKFKEGDLDEAIANLDAALLNLQLADLPEDMQTIGFFQPYLPDVCRSVDLDKAYTSLQEIRAQEQMLPEEIPDAGDAFSQSDRVFIEMEIRRFMEILGEDCSRGDEMAIFLDEVEDFINYFITSRLDWFERSYYRMWKYRETTDRILAEKRMPSELAYLAFIESGYMYRATSTAKARGIWQFMPGTGKNYGLKINAGIDQRLDPVKATIAAREYLLDLISIFGSESFLLAMASYNAGEGRVQRCLRQLDDPFENRSFWKIRECLHQETREYIPRIIAAGILCENSKRFGLNLKTPEEIFQEYDVIICPDRIRLKSIADAVGITVNALQDMNPDLPSGGSWTPVTNMHLYIPSGKAELFNVAVTRMEKAPEVSYSDTVHIVRSGESLYSIGRLYKIPFKQIAAWNNIPSPYRIKPGQKLRLQSKSSVSASGSAKTGDTTATTSAGTLEYTVKKGNYLAGIGSLFGVSARNIMSWNSLKRGTIYPGQRLSIKPGFPVETVKHSVVSGDTLTGVASKYGVSVDTILFINGMTTERSLRIGETLVIYRKR